MTRAELVARTSQLIDEGVRLQANPSLDAFRTWLQVGRPTSIVRGRPMTGDEAAAYVREVAAAKTAVLRMSLDAVDRLAMPFIGETLDADAP